MRKLFFLTFLGLILQFSSFALGPISGGLSICLGSTTYLSDSLNPGGTWASSDSAIAAVMSPSGTYGSPIYGATVGTATITYTLGASTVTVVVTVNPSPTPITGSSTVCAGSAITLGESVAGGTWSSSSVAIATVATATGVVVGVSSGVTQIFYTLPDGCFATKPVTVNAITVGPVSGDSIICAGITTPFSDVTPGGVWSSSNTLVATVTASGVVTGVSAGTASISYTVTGACGSASATHTVSVSATATVGAISGSPTVTAGASTPYTDATPSGTWSSGNPSVATVSAGGVVYGVSAGTSVITYTVTSACGSGMATKTITVDSSTPLNIISGEVHFRGPLLTASVVKVYLITYAPSTLLLEAIDSISISTSGGVDSLYYQFLGKPTDSYRVKAAVYPTTFSPTGYIPTYAASSNYWSTANVLYHTGGADTNDSIDMAYGIATTGPGFISGYVTTGANKGTSASLPAVGLLIYVADGGGSIIEFTYTDSSGYYKLNNLPFGEPYTVYPENLNYATTPYSGISLSTGYPSMTNANFIEHTISLTITPGNEGVMNTVSQITSITAFPNPATGVLNIAWNAKTAETGTINVTDIMGHSVYGDNIDISAGQGSKQIDLSALANGVYLLNMKSGTTNYNAKIQVRH